MSPFDQIRNLQNQNTRDSVAFTSIISELEDELKRMKDKNLAQAFIDKKDHQIQTLIDYYNSTDQVITCFKMMVINLQLELRLSDSLLMSTASNREILIEALMNFKMQKFDGKATKAKKD